MDIPVSDKAKIFRDNALRLLKLGWAGLYRTGVRL